MNTTFHFKPSYYNLNNTVFIILDSETKETEELE